MNIFFLSWDPRECAQMHCDKHVVKMTLETAQMLSTAHRILDKEKAAEALYKPTHANHPCNVWVRQSKHNYYWLFELFNELSTEYLTRYGKVHACWSKLGGYLVYAPANIPDIEPTMPPQCMPEYCKVPGDLIKAYHNYYIYEKADFARWTRRSPPQWYLQGINNNAHVLV